MRLSRRYKRAAVQTVPQLHAHRHRTRRHSARSGNSQEIIWDHPKCTAPQNTRIILNSQFSRKSMASNFVSSKKTSILTYRCLQRLLFRSPCCQNYYMLVDFNGTRTEWRGTRGLAGAWRETRRKEGGRCMEGGRRGVGSRRKRKKNYTTLCNILQSEKCKEAGTNKIQGRKEYGKQEV